MFEFILCCTLSHISHQIWTQISG